MGPCDFSLITILVIKRFILNLKLNDAASLRMYYRYGLFFSKIGIRKNFTSKKNTAAAFLRTFKRSGTSFKSFDKVAVTNLQSLHT
jgi:hypothetical protein